jgi:hypothetical protein
MGDAARTLFSASISLLAGYSFIRFSYYRRFAAEHLRTDRFALHVLGYSFLFYVAGEIVAAFMPSWAPERIAEVAADLRSAGINAPVINALTLAVILAAADNIRVLYLMRNDASAPLDGHHFFEAVRMAAVARYVRASNDSALRALFRATILQKPLMVTLRSHKVYVGKPYYLTWDDPTQLLTFIKILPIKSGYRDPTTKKVGLPTRYDELDQRFVEIEGEVVPQRSDAKDPLARDILGLTNGTGEVIAKVDIEDLGVVIAWPDVESLTIYDENLYAAFQAQGAVSKSEAAESSAA